MARLFQAQASEGDAEEGANNKVSSNTVTNKEGNSIRRKRDRVTMAVALFF
jgi:hypothetical protein